MIHALFCKLARIFKFGASFSKNIQIGGNISIWYMRVVIVELHGGGGDLLFPAHFECERSPDLLELINVESMA